MKKAKIFMNGQSEAVRLPKDFRFGSDEVYIHKLGNAVILLPKDSPWENFIEALDEFTSDFMEERNQPGDQKRKVI
jgi:antitoxin VapB